MITAVETARWQVAGRSVRGASHRRRNLGNQDALGWISARLNDSSVPVQRSLTVAPLGLEHTTSEEHTRHGGATVRERGTGLEISPPWVTRGGMPTGSNAIAAAVADGHGCARSFRSAEGAAIAVQTALSLLAEAANSPLTESRLESLRHELVERWRAGVNQHALANPPPDSDRQDCFEIYGTTLVSVLATDTHVLYLQIGDGDILTVSSEGVVDRPWPRDQRLLGVETTSLSSPDAAGDVRILYVPASPALILLATDGYSNSFRDDAGFLKIGSDLLNAIRQEGLTAVEDDLEQWLMETSEQGSGDDISVVLVSRTGQEGCDGC